MECITLSEALARSPEELRYGLEWFLARSGSDIDWPEPPPGAPLEFFATRPKGIYKPRNSPYVLSIRQSLGGPYDDRDVTVRDDGSWLIAYSEESPTKDNTTPYTNDALRRNMEDRVPVAVFLQAKSTGSKRYLVRGLAMVTRYFDGFFYLEGFSNGGVAAIDDGDALIDCPLFEAAHRRLDDLVTLIDVAGEVPHTDVDARQRVAASIVRRTGQGKFRSELMSAYVGRCAVTGCSVTQVLDAAHIRPYNGPKTNVLANGLLLRTDVHSLFDLGLLAVLPAERTIAIAPALRVTEYGDLHGARLVEPLKSAWRPSDAALEAHLAWCRDTVRPDAA